MEAVSTYLKLREVVGSRIRLIQDAARLSGARQPYLAPRKLGGGQDRLIRRKTSLTGETLDVSTARQAYPPSADVIRNPASLSAAKQPCRPPGQGCRRQDNVRGSQDDVIRGKSRLSAGEQDCLAADKLARWENNVVSPPTRSSAAKQPCRAPGQGRRRQDNVRASRDDDIRDKSRLSAGKQGCLAADKLVSLPTTGGGLLFFAPSSHQDAVSHGGRKSVGGHATVPARQAAFVRHPLNRARERSPDMAEKEQVVEEREVDQEELESVSGGDDEGPPAPPVASDGR